jgi:fermentation-respiration switch protein FrsA (DUF1100 family)
VARGIKIVLLSLASLALTGYLAFCGLLYAEQRQLVFLPTGIVLGDPPSGTDYQLLNVTVPDLGRIKAWWMPPASRTLPTVVFFHGNATDRRDFMKLGTSPHSRGWGVVLASYRGYSGNPGSPSEAGLMDDARATLAAVTPQVGPIILWGHSLGSGVAARMASEKRGVGLVLESPYTSVAAIGAAQYPFVPVRLLSRDPFDTLSLVPRIQIPVLIFHSRDDPTIPFAMGQELANRFGSRATFVAMTGAGHHPHRQDISAIVVQWAQRQHLAGY